MSASHDLIQRAAQGETDALSALATEYRPIARRTAFGLLGDADAAEDVAQEAMIRLQTSLKGFRREAELKSWLHRVTVNLVYDHVRRVRRRRAEVPLTEARDHSERRPADPHASVDAERARHALREALGRLPDEYREVLVLRFVSDLSYAEIAAVMGAPEGTVASRIFRALARLGRELEPKHLEILR